MTERTEMRGPAIDLALSGDASRAHDSTAARAKAERWAERLHDRDTSLWSTDPRVQAGIADRLGWLDAPHHFSLLVPSIEAFAIARRDEGFIGAIVAGMGGSSLAPDVLNRTFGSGDDWPSSAFSIPRTPKRLRRPSTTSIRSIRCSSCRRSQARQQNRRRSRPTPGHGSRRLSASTSVAISPGDNMVAITDPGKSLEAIPHSDELRELFLNPPDIGGRYSALTYVGLVPAALIGLDHDPLLASAEAMLGSSRDNDPARNPALALGLAIGALAVNGRDKLTFVADPELASVRGLGGAAARREHGQARRRASCPSISSRSAWSRTTGRTGPSCASGLDGLRGRRRPTDARPMPSWRSWRPPAIR